MDYIDFKEFKKQPEKIQKVLKDWWQPKYFDLIHYEFGTTFCGSNSFDDTVDIFDWKGIERNWIKKDKVIPLLTESQLRKFIEEKTDKRIWISYNPNYCEGNVIIIDLANNYDELKIKHAEYAITTKDLLEAYWKVAIKIAEDI